GVGFQSAACWMSGGAFAPPTGWTSMGGTMGVSGLGGSGFLSSVISAYVDNASSSAANGFPRFLVDINGDGLADIVGLFNNDVFVALSNGKSFPAVGDWLVGGSLLGGSWTGATPRTVVDVLGTGRAGILGIGNQGLFVAPSGGNSVAPDLLAGISNGL